MARKEQAQDLSALPVAEKARMLEALGFGEAAAALLASTREIPTHYVGEIVGVELSDKRPTAKVELRFADESGEYGFRAWAYVPTDYPHDSISATIDLS